METVQDDKDLLYKRAAFGLQVEQFLSSDIGKYMLARADGDIASSFGELKSCNPKDGIVVQGLQNKIWRAESVKHWLSDVITDGFHSLEILDGYDN